MSVVVDPLRAERVLGLAAARLSEHVAYIYRKQLEEAEIIVINKCDLVDSTRRERLTAALVAVNPGATILECSARDKTGLDPWFVRLLSDTSQAAAITEIDYDRYALGESLLGWLNAEVRVGTADTDGNADFDGNELLVAILSHIRGSLEASDHEIAHLKGTLSVEGDPYELAAANLVRTADAPVLSHRLAEPVDIGRLLVNLRAEADPADLERAVRAAVATCTTGIPHEFLHLEHFRPGRPVPTHRIPARV
jgi:G3E family GTPase